ncbi:MAG TPA: APC family permease [Pseudolysinimonas sp.]|nr:APC family permease [Pseudolysinimonas sp.]
MTKIAVGQPADGSTPTNLDSDGRRDFSLRSVFGVAFAFISPIIALYAIFNLGILTAGPSFWWAFVVVLAGQLLVALIFGELSSRWPEEGGVYAWTRHLAGPKTAWWTGWTYAWTLICLNAAAAFAVSAFVVEVMDLDEAGTGPRIIVAAVFIVLATVVNSLSLRLLKIFIAISVVCEVVGSLYIGTVLLVFHRQNDPSVLMSGFVDGGVAFTMGPFLAAVAIAGWALIGFESAADLAAEVKRPERNVPLAQIASLVLVAATIMYAAAAVILATPGITSGDAGGGDAIMATISTNLGEGVVLPMTIVVAIGFLAGIAAVSAALSRAVHAMAQRNSLPASTWIARLSVRDQLPRNALLLTSGASIVILALSVGLGFYDVMIAMSTGGFYIAFFIPIAAVLVARVRRTWRPGVFHLRRAGALVNLLAFVWLAFEILNISWPRPLGLPWYVEWGCVLMYALLGVLGLVVFFSLRNRFSQESSHHD